MGYEYAAMNNNEFPLVYSTMVSKTRNCSLQTSCMGLVTDEGPWMYIVHIGVMTLYYTAASKDYRQTMYGTI